MDWDTLDASQYPDGQYMWHNGTETIKHQLWLGGDALSGFHAFEIEDYGDHLVVKLSGYWPYIVSNDVFGDGYVGLGCGAVVSGVPGFDEITYCDFTAVEEVSWGRIKALFR